MRYRIEANGSFREVDVQREPNGWLVRVDGGVAQRFTGQQVGSVEWRLVCDGVGRTSRVAIDGDRWLAQSNGAFRSGAITDPRAAAGPGPQVGQGMVKAPMPGLVARVLVAVGQHVQAGEVLVVVEAMKMENEFKSKIAGVVRELHVAPGDTVAANTRLVLVEPHDAKR